MPPPHSMATIDHIAAFAIVVSFAADVVRIAWRWIAAGRISLVPR